VPNLPIIILEFSAPLSLIAITAFPKNAAKLALLAAVIACAIGGILLAMRPQDGFGSIAVVLAIGALGCSVNALRTLVIHSVRWVHRFVIYTGYGATLSAMAVVGLGLAQHTVSALSAAGALRSVFFFGSAAIFIAKIITLKRTARVMPGSNSESR